MNRIMFTEIILGASSFVFGNSTVGFFVFCFWFIRLAKLEKPGRVLRIGLKQESNERKVCFDA